MTWVHINKTPANKNLDVATTGKICMLRRWCSLILRCTRPGGGKLNYVWKIQGEDGRSKSVSRWVCMVRCTALAFCTQLQVAISVYDASNAAPCAWHAQSANAARGQVALNRWQLTACTTKRRLVSKKSQTSQIPILPTFFLPHGQALPRQSKIQTARTFGSWNVLA